MAKKTFLRCKFCRWVTVVGNRAYDGASHWDRLRCHVEFDHKLEFEKLQLWLDSVTPAIV